MIPPDAILASLGVAVSVFLGAMLGLSLHRLLPARHLTKETQDVIRLGTGMLSVLASLVLGLLIATAKGSYDNTDRAIRGYAAELALMNEVLRDYGQDAARPRDSLRAYTARMLAITWPQAGAPPPEFGAEDTRRLIEQVRESIRALQPRDDAQAALKVEAGGIGLNLLRQRWQLVEQQGPSVQNVVLVILTTWIAAIFVSFGLNAPRNGAVVGAFLICALAIGGAVFLILEMDRPLDGIMQVPRWPIEHALAQMQW